MANQSTRGTLEMAKFIGSGLVVYRQSVLLNQPEYYKRGYFQSGVKLKPTYAGTLSEGARTRMGRALQLLIDISKKRKIYNPITRKDQYFKLAFFTLTLSAPQGIHTDSEIKDQLLKRFIRVWRDKGMTNYVWRAERQKNGNIHFHFVTDMFIPVQELRDSWNNIQNRFEYIDYFESKHKHRDPNSTDIKSIREDQHVKAYILKYMTKPEQDGAQQVLDVDQTAKQKGKVWDCSKNLKLKNDTEDFLSTELWKDVTSMATAGLVKRLDFDYYKLFFFSAHQRRTLFKPKFIQPYEDYLERVRCFQDTGT